MATLIEKNILTDIAVGITIIQQTRKICIRRQL